jgi:hypothetical protein
MKRSEKIPTARVCDLFSIMAVAAGICAALVYVLPRPLSVQMVVLGLLIIFGFFVIAVVVRILGIIGQNLVNLNAKMNVIEAVLTSSRDTLENSRDTLENSRDVLKSSIENLGCHVDQNAQRLRNVVDQVNCDTRDLNQNIRDIRTFFEQIEKHLNLKK